jgi:hypothetical protein
MEQIVRVIDQNTVAQDQMILIKRKVQQLVHIIIIIISEGNMTINHGIIIIIDDKREGSECYILLFRINMRRSFEIKTKGCNFLEKMNHQM